jgi:site-specific DNA-methyltransferase (adenine-specific)
MGNIKYFKYDWIWEKGRASGFVHAKNKPLKSHEIISIFSPGTTVHIGQSKNRMNYFPQMNIGKPYSKKQLIPNVGELHHTPSLSNINFIGTISNNIGQRYPRSILQFSMHNVGNICPTQKPVELCEYLIKTYSNKVELVLDNCIGSGTTAIASINTNRNWIGIEKNQEYFDLANKRINDHLQKMEIGKCLT